MVEVFKSTSLRRMTTGGNYINVSADVVLASDYASLEAELKAAREETERWAAVANREDEARQMWQADSARLQKAAKLALQRLGELNRDDEAGVRMVLANAIDAALSQPPVGEREIRPFNPVSEEQEIAGMARLPASPGRDRYKFKAGDRVRLSVEGIAANLCGPKHNDASGVVVRVDKFNAPTVLWDYRKTPSHRYYPDFIEPVQRWRIVGREG